MVWVPGIVTAALIYVIWNSFGQVETEKRKEEQRQFGVFFDDDYNYLQHLREASQPAELVSSAPFVRETFSQMEDDEDEELPSIPVRLVAPIYC